MTFAGEMEIFPDGGYLLGGAYHEGGTQNAANKFAFEAKKQPTLYANVQNEKSLTLLCLRPPTQAVMYSSQIFLHLGSSTTLYARKTFPDAACPKGPLGNYETKFMVGYSLMLVWAISGLGRFSVTEGLAIHYCKWGGGGNATEML